MSSVGPAGGAATSAGAVVHGRRGGGFGGALPVLNLYQLYYAALALYQVGGRPWRTFNQRVRDPLARMQVSVGCERGSWVGSDRLQNPILSTTFAALTLETYYRYQREHGEEPLPAEPAPPPSAELLALRRAQELLGSVQAAAASGDRAQLRSELLAYRAALPAGHSPHPGVTRLERLLAFEQLQEQVAGAQSDQPAPELVRSLEAFQRRLELDRIGARGEEREQIAALQERVRAWRLHLLGRAEPGDALRAALRQVRDQEAHGSPSPAERALLSASIKLAHAELATARRERDARAFGRAERLLRRLDTRRLWERMAGPERQTLEPVRAQLALGRIEALAALELRVDALDAARAFRARYVASPLLERLAAVERVLLLERARRGEADEGERRRLARSLGDLGEGPLATDQALALSRTLLDAGLAEDAERPLERALETERSREEVSRLHLSLALVARAREDPRRAHRHLLAVAAPISERLDARLAWCWLHRAQGRPQVALQDYAKLLPALRDEAPETWWDVAEETARTYVEAKRRAEARRFLEGMRRRDRTFGGDAARRERLIALMRELDLRR